MGGAPSLFVFRKKKTRLGERSGRVLGIPLAVDWYVGINIAPSDSWEDSGEIIIEGK